MRIADSHEIHYIKNIIAMKKIQILYLSIREVIMAAKSFQNLPLEIELELQVKGIPK